MDDFARAVVVGATVGTTLADADDTDDIAERAITTAQIVTGAHENIVDFGDNGLVFVFVSVFVSSFVTDTVALPSTEAGNIGDNDAKWATAQTTTWVQKVPGFQKAGQDEHAAESIVGACLRS
jgi:hypothetical protein